jgi:hypothetical protein
MREVVLTTSCTLCVCTTLLSVWLKRDCPSWPLEYFCSSPGWEKVWNSRWNENWQKKPKYSEKTYPIAPLSTTNPTCPDLGSNPGLRGGMSAINYLSCVMARSSSVGIATKLLARRPRNLGSIPGSGKRRLLPQLWGPRSLLSDGYRGGSFPRYLRSWSCNWSAPCS